MSILTSDFLLEIYHNYLDGTLKRDDINIKRLATHTISIYFEKINYDPIYDISIVLENQILYNPMLLYFKIEHNPHKLVYPIFKNCVFELRDNAAISFTNPKKDSTRFQNCKFIVMENQ